jgi:hypothetical protein
MKRKSSVPMSSEGLVIRALLHPARASGQLRKDNTPAAPQHPEK